MPEVYNPFLYGDFSVQMVEANPFGQTEADKTIENTINKNCKTETGYIGFSANFAATQHVKCILHRNIQKITEGTFIEIMFIKN